MFGSVLARYKKMPEDPTDPPPTYLASKKPNPCRVKKKYLRGNTQSFMTKALRKAIMNRSRLRNIYNNHNTTKKRLCEPSQKN